MRNISCNFVVMWLGEPLAGHTPVAVKMLKVDAAEGSKSVWQEFMAEFSLLKQVEHPNVIKLLGACTTTGGPPYLVMEFAEYGALRFVSKSFFYFTRVALY